MKGRILSNWVGGQQATARQPEPMKLIGERSYARICLGFGGGNVSRRTILLSFPYPYIRKKMNSIHQSEETNSKTKEKSLGCKEEAGTGSVWMDGKRKYGYWKYNWLHSG